MKKLAVLTAVVFMFGVAGVAGAGLFDQAPADPTNQIVGGGGTNANDGSTAVAVKDNLNGNQLLSNNTETETTNVNKPVTVTKTETETTNVDKSVAGGQSAASTGGTAVGLNNSANGNSLLSGNTKTVNVNKAEDGSLLGTANAKIEAEKGGIAANNGSNVVSQKAEDITNELAGSHPTTVGATTNTTTTLGAGAVNGAGSVSTGSGAVANGANANTGAFYQGANAKNNSDNPNAEDGSQLMTGGSGSQTMNKAEDGGMVATGGSNYSVEAEKGSAATVNGNASVDSRDQSTHTYVKADAENGSLSAINTTGNITLDKSINLSNIGVALQNTELDGKVEDNKLIIGGPEATSITKSGTTKSGSADSGKAYSGKAETGEAESGEAETGKAVAVSKGKAFGFAGAASKAKADSGNTGAAAIGGSASKSATIAVAVDPTAILGTSATSADGNSSKSKADSSNTAGANGGAANGTSTAGATGGATDGSSSATSDSGAATSGAANSGAANSGAATSGAANSGDANGGNATSAAVTATTNFSTGNNNFTTGSFNGIGAFNVNSGISSLNQSSINVNAVVGGNLAGR